MTRIYNYKTEQIEDIHDINDQVKYNELIESGDAIKLDLPELDKYEREASELHAKYQADIQAIKNSDNPLYTDDVKAYEMDKIEQEYREQSAAIEENYSAWRAQAIEQAKAKAATATVKVSENDRQIAEQFADRAALDIAASGAEALTQIKNDIELLTDGQKTALAGKIPGLLANIEGETISKQAVIDAVRTIKNADMNAIKIAKKLPASVLTEQRISDIAKDVVENHPSAIVGGGLDREFREKYLKAGDN